MPGSWTARSLGSSAPIGLLLNSTARGKSPAAAYAAAKVSIENALFQLVRAHDLCAKVTARRPFRRRPLGEVANSQARSFNVVGSLGCKRYAASSECLASS